MLNEWIKRFFKENLEGLFFYDIIYLVYYAIKYAEYLFITKEGKHEG